MPTYIKGKSEREERRKKAQTLKKYKHRMRRSQIVKAYNGGPNVVVRVSKSGKRKKGGCPFCA
jgi:hypothetical protein